MIDKKNLPLMRGKVINNNDPFKIGRVQVRIYCLHGTNETGIKDGNLEWAFPSFLSASYDSGSFIVPEVGSNVWILFEDNDENKMVYIGSFYGIGAKKTTDVEIGNTIGYRRDKRVNVREIPHDVMDLDDKILYKSAMGNTIGMNDRVGSIFVKNAVGEEIYLNSNIDGIEVMHRDELNTFIREDKDNIKIMEKVKNYTELAYKSLNNSYFKIKNYLQKSILTFVLKGKTDIKIEMDTDKEEILLSVGDNKVSINKDEVNITGNLTVSGSINGKKV